VLLCLVGLACFSHCTSQVEDEKARRAAIALEELGGLVFQDKQAVPPYGKALRERIGDAYSVKLTGSRVTDGDLALLSHFPEIWNLELNRTEIGDTGLPHLQCLTGLQWLDLSSTKVTSSGLVHLTALTDLKTLLLNDTAVGDQGEITSASPK
jgi:hypothetical protein